MDDISLQTISYSEVRAGTTIENDCYEIGALFTDSHRAAFLANPNLKDEQQPLLCLSRVDEKVGGILMLYPSAMLVDNERVDTMGASTLEVAEELRHLALGVELMFYPIRNKDNNIVLYAGVSEMALPMYKKIGFRVLEYPRAMQLRKSRSILASKGLSGVPLKVLSWMVDSCLLALRSFSKLFCLRLGKRYSVKEENHVPEWAESMVLRDNHKYKELHDQKWLEWNLKYNLHGRSRDKQRFYSIYDKETPVGFFMIKERFREVAGGVLKNLVVGSIVEWGSYDEQILKESDIYALASKCFEKDVAIVEIASADIKALKKMKKYAYLPHGFSHIIFKDLKRKYSDISNIDNWRVRLGYADVILT